MGAISKILSLIDRGGLPNLKENTDGLSGSQIITIGINISYEILLTIFSLFFIHMQVHCVGYTCLLVL